MKKRDGFSRAHSGNFHTFEREHVQPVANNDEFKRISTQHGLTSTHGKDTSLVTFTSAVEQHSKLSTPNNLAPQQVSENANGTNSAESPAAVTHVTPDRLLMLLESKFGKLEGMVTEIRAGMGSLQGEVNRIKANINTNPEASLDANANPNASKIDSS
jgi:hypothetical protein